MADLLDANDPEQCGYEVTVIWPTGERTNYSGVNLDASTLATMLLELAHHIRAELEDARASA